MLSYILLTRNFMLLGIAHDKTTQVDQSLTRKLSVLFFGVSKRCGDYRLATSFQ